MSGPLFPCAKTRLQPGGIRHYISSFTRVKSTKYASKLHFPHCPLSISMPQHSQMFVFRTLVSPFQVGFLSSKSTPDLPLFSHKSRCSEAHSSRQRTEATGANKQPPRRLLNVLLPKPRAQMRVFAIAVEMRSPESAGTWHHVPLSAIPAPSQRAPALSSTDTDHQAFR